MGYQLMLIQLLTLISLLWTTSTFAQYSKVYFPERTYSTATPFIQQPENHPKGDPTISPQIGVRVGNLSLGAQYSIVIAEPSFLPHLNNSLSGEAGVFMVLDDETLVIPVNIRWDLHVDIDWTVYVSPGLALLIETDSSPKATLRPAGQIGGFWHLDTYFSLRAGIDTASRSLLAGGAIRFRP